MTIIRRRGLTYHLPEAPPRRPIIEVVPQPCREPAPPLLRRGIEQFNAGEFFDQHETLEDLWRAETRPVRQD